MEDRSPSERPNPTEDQETTEKLDKKPRKRLSSLVEWIAARQEKRGEAEEPEAKRGIFKRFFDKLVHVEPLQSEVETSKDVEAEEADTSIKTLYARETYDQDAEVQDEIHEPAAFEWVQKAQAGEKQPDEPDGASELLPVQPEAFTTYPIPPMEEIARAYQETTEPDHVSEPLPVQQSSPETRRVLERSSEPLAAATLVGLGAEYFGRKRADRKEAAVRLQADKMHDKKLDTLRQENRQAIESLREKRDMQTAPQQALRPEKTPQRPEVSNEFSKITQNRQEAVARAAKRLQTENIPVPQPESPKRRAEEIARRIEEYERRHEAPEKVLKEAVTAAEVDAPVERVYERRQEVRDEPTVASAAGGIMSVGTILQQSGQPYLNDVQAASGGRPQSLDPIHQREVYKQAAQNGFMGAICIIVLAILAYLLV